MKDLDYSKFKDIRKKLNQSCPLSQCIFDSPSTKVYLLHEFDLQGKTQIVVIVKWWDMYQEKYNYSMCVWDKEKALGKNQK
jgi:hypothetical protein